MPQAVGELRAVDPIAGRTAPERLTVNGSDMGGVLDALLSLAGGPQAGRQRLDARLRAGRGQEKYLARMESKRIRAKREAGRLAATTSLTGAIDGHFKLADVRQG